MKKALIACVAVVAMFALANAASAVTCTLDQHPAATLLVPYFQVTVDGNGNPIGSGALARDTIVTIANASAAPMIAHVSVFDRYSTLQLDFDVALTGFDVQAWRMSDILSGNLPNTVNAEGDNACQSNAAANVYPDPDGFIRVRPLAGNTPDPSLDNTAGITNYPSPAFTFPLGKLLAQECDGTIDPVAIGYITIDHANYCNLSNPTDPNYYFKNAIGMENNLFGEIIFTSGNGLPTYGISTVNLEADTTIGQAAVTAALNDDNARSFYARYWQTVPSTYPGVVCPNCGSGVSGTDLSIDAPWDVTLQGDQREPLGLKYALRWFDLTSTGVLTTNFMVWRGTTFPESDNEFCTTPETDEDPVTLVFFDEDENTVSTGGCPSPCSSPTFNFEHETNLKNITQFSHPTSGSAGWVSVSFLSSSSNQLDQAWAAYSFEGSIALESVLVPGTALDPNTCDPLGVTGIEQIIPVVPTIPTGVGP